MSQAGSFSATLTAVPSNIGLLRQFAAHTLQLTQSPVSEADATLVLSELVTNAIEYGGVADVSVTLQYTTSTLTIEVRDENPVPPRRPRTPSTHGRGLSIVDRLSTMWGSGHRRDGGKTVWAELSAYAVDAALPAYASASS